MVSCDVGGGLDAPADGDRSSSTARRIRAIFLLLGHDNLRRQSAKLLGSKLILPPTKCLCKAEDSADNHRAVLAFVEARHETAINLDLVETK
jgi:hypothetical protein